jgi:hypothetical protein
VRVLVDGGAPRRKGSGVVEHVTVARSIEVEGETKAVMVLGEDLAAGRHELKFVTDPQTALWVHLPWQRVTAEPRTSRWIAGDFEP